MMITKKLFYQTGLGLGNEDWFYLAREAETGRTFVMHEWTRRNGNSYQPGSADIELDVFLSKGGTPQHMLRELIGTLATKQA
jgi:hypothetical protein